MWEYWCKGKLVKREYMDSIFPPSIPEQHGHKGLVVGKNINSLKEVKGLWKVTKIDTVNEVHRDSFTREITGIYYLITIAKVSNPFKIKVKKIEPSVFTHEEFYVGRRI